MKKNVGNLDAALRSLLALFLVLLGLFWLEGLEGDILGILVALTALLPVYMVVTRKCFVFRFFGISSIPDHGNES